MSSDELALSTLATSPELYIEDKAMLPMTPRTTAPTLARRASEGEREIHPRSRVGLVNDWGYRVGRINGYTQEFFDG